MPNKPLTNLSIFQALFGISGYTDASLGLGYSHCQLGTPEDFLNLVFFFSSRECQRGGAKQRGGQNLTWRPPTENSFPPPSPRYVPPPPFQCHFCYEVPYKLAQLAQAVSVQLRRKAVGGSGVAQHRLSAQPNGEDDERRQIPS